MHDGIQIIHIYPTTGLPTTFIVLKTKKRKELEIR